NRRRPAGCTSMPVRRNQSPHGRPCAPDLSWRGEADRLSPCCYNPPTQTQPEPRSYAGVRSRVSRRLRKPRSRYGGPRDPFRDRHSSSASTGVNMRVALGLLASLVLAAPASAERLPLKSYTTADGLPHNQINRIVRDSRGFLWFCTGDGLSRFDGYSFTNFGTPQGLPHRRVNDLLETRDGRLWVATEAGLVRFDPGGVPDA